MSHLLWLQGFEVAAPSSAVTSPSAGQGFLSSPPQELALDAGKGRLGHSASRRGARAAHWEQVAQGSVPALITMSTSHVRHPGERGLGAAQEQLQLCLDEYLMMPHTMKGCSERRKGAPHPEWSGACWR